MKQALLLNVTGQNALQSLKRRWAVETGRIELLYTLSEGVTRTLVLHGIDASTIGHDIVEGVSPTPVPDGDWEIKANEITSIINDNLQVSSLYHPF